MMTIKPQLSKGPRQEESLRRYFLSLGYFVVRGVEYVYEKQTITDVDLWIYLKVSPFSRQRANVDIKAKRTPQALERVFWAKGLQSALALDLCIVATTERRDAISRYGRDTGVVILDGSMLGRINDRFKNDKHRIDEEELYAFVIQGKADKLGKSWIERLRSSKARLLTHLDFDGCNSWLMDVKYFIEETMTNIQRSAVACRLLYLEVAYFLIGLDYTLRESVFAEPEIVRQNILEGIRFGKGGKTKTEHILRTAARLIEAAGQSSVGLVDTFYAEYQKIPSEILGEFLIQNKNTSKLFDLALEFEDVAYQRAVRLPRELSQEARTTLSVFLDYFSIERRAFFQDTGQAAPSMEGSRSDHNHPTSADERKASSLHQEEFIEKETPLSRQQKPKIKS